MGRVPPHYVKVQTQSKKTFNHELGAQGGGGGGGIWEKIDGGFGRDITVMSTPASGAITPPPQQRKQHVLPPKTPLKSRPRILDYPIIWEPSSFNHELGPLGRFWGRGLLVKK